VTLALIAAADERFRWRALAPVYVLAVLPRAHPLGRRRAGLAIEQLADAPLLLPRREFASRGWFDAACEVAHLRPRVLLENGTPATLVALARAGYGVAIVPSTTHIARAGIRAMPVVHRGVALGRWMSVAWHPRRFLAPYGERFVDELAAYCRAHPGWRIRRPPPLPRPKAHEAPLTRTRGRTDR
jgi:DNA-binding transcriptional LysR family regulator